MADLAAVLPAQSGLAGRLMEIEMFGIIEGTGVSVLDPRFSGVVPGSARVERLWTGARWSEGPAWFPAHNTLVWSDIPNDRMLRYDAMTGQTGVFRQPARNANGNTVDGQGRLVTCEHGARQVTRTEHDGSITVLASHFEARRLNSPNDVVVKSDGSIWFTDPDYGILSDYEGDKAQGEIGRCNVYRIDGQSGALTIVADDFVKPNGIAFSPDETILYIADTGASHDPENGPRHIRACAVNADGATLGRSITFATCTAGLFDGFRLDVVGRLWTSAADGVHVYDLDGTLIGKVAIPEIVANLCWGGPRLNRLFICGTTSLYAMMTHTNGATSPRR